MQDLLYFQQDQQYVPTPYTLYLEFLCIIVLELH